MIPSDGGGNFDGVEETNNGRKEDVEVVVQVGAKKLNGAQKLQITKIENVFVIYLVMFGNF